MTTTHLDLYALLHETHPEPLRSADPCSCPAAGGYDPDSGNLEIEHYDGDGECRGTETWSDYDRAYL